MKLYVRFFYVFYVFFSKSKKHDFLRFFELLHTFSRTVANSTTGEAILFGACLTGLQGLRNLLGWEPSQATAGATAAAEVTVAGAASIHLPRDGADVGAAANTVAAAGGGSRIFERGGVSSAEDTRIEVPQAPRGMERGGVCPSPEFFFK